MQNYNLKFKKPTNPQMHTNLTNKRLGMRYELRNTTLEITKHRKHLFADEAGLRGRIKLKIKPLKIYWKLKIIN